MRQRKFIRVHGRGVCGGIRQLPDGRIGFWTSSKSGEARRLRNNPRVTVVPCNNSGKVADGSLLVAGTARLVSGGPEFDEIRSKVNAKYGVMVPISKFFTPSVTSVIVRSRTATPA
ncbi:pyridoxamine 5'-phosphate oxidase family protein [Rhodococcus sp. IEGM 1241]|uniref:pyridoxamine 5'-phosphate oxidase family protein n=1 Tax=Rhodococcus sp. IEGM 1241 TaxID=3082228 RepID=UPI002953333D|nr:pyridoxamine 5'-phosphate oxidase family protein [Rhodococcus sp. IEGM 1241]MDV8011670.1 pyridoxamine 5'-phosphate oxidase family protein [Rhodococcus sp. IEGM 1241]